MERFSEMKLLFMHYACLSSYPTVTQLTMDEFANEFELLDGTHLKR